MRFRPGSLALLWPTIDARTKRPRGGRVTMQLVSHMYPRSAQTVQQPARQMLGCLGAPAGRHEDFQCVTPGVDGAPTLAKTLRRDFPRTRRGQGTKGLAQGTARGKTGLGLSHGATTTEFRSKRPDIDVRGHRPFLQTPRCATSDRVPAADTAPMDSRVSYLRCVM